MIALGLAPDTVMVIVVTLDGSGAGAAESLFEQPTTSVDAQPTMNAPRRAEENILTIRPEGQDKGQKNLRDRLNPRYQLSLSCAP